MGPFAVVAPQLYDRGLFPVPVKAGKKKAITLKWTTYSTRDALTVEVMEEWAKKYEDESVGLLLGTPVTEDLQLIAIDVDRDELVEPVKSAIGRKELVSKVGKKGLTIFMLAGPGVATERIRSGGASAPVEVLAKGTQTVLPPSIHPDGMEYRWIGPSILDTDLRTLPVFTKAVRAEIQAWAKGKAKHFEALNAMERSTEEGGGTVHNSGYPAVAYLVTAQWDDYDIMERVLRAISEASDRAGMEFNRADYERKVEEWIESAKERGFDEIQVTKKPKEIVIAEEFVASLRVAGQPGVMSFEGMTYIYRDGCWSPSDRNRLITALLQRGTNAPLAVLKNAAEYVSLSTVVENPPVTKDFVCLRNGTYDINADAMIGWSAYPMILHRANVLYEPNPQCPVYDSLLLNIFRDNLDIISTVEEFFGSTFVPDNAYQKALFILGPGASGKSTLANLLAAMHAPEAVSSVPVTALHKEYFRAMLFGKLLNVSGEQSLVNPIADDYFKKIVGGDKIDARLPYDMPRQGVLSVRFLEIANQLPLTRDTSSALLRRMVVAPVQTISGKLDPTVPEKLLGELPGVFFHLMRAYRDLRARKQFQAHSAATDALHTYAREQNPVLAWVDDECAPTEAGQPGTPSSELYDNFCLYSRQAGIRFIPSREAWGRILTGLGYPSVVKRVGSRLFRVRALVAHANDLTSI